MASDTTWLWDGFPLTAIHYYLPSFLSICSQEALTKINVHKDRDEKEQIVFNQSMKVLERLMAHEKKMNEFMSIKCNDRTEFKLEEADRLERGFTKYT